MLVRHTFAWSIFISILKLVCGLLILAILSRGEVGVLSLYGELQNGVALAVAFMGLSANNGITNAVAQSPTHAQTDILAKARSIIIVGTTLYCGIGVLGLRPAIVIPGLDRISTEIYMLTLGFCCVLHNFYRSYLVACGRIIFSSVLDLFRSIFLLAAAFLFIVGIFETFTLAFGVSTFALIIFIRFTKEGLLKKPLLNFDSGTRLIARAGFATAFSGVIFALQSLALRDMAIKNGGTALADDWELVLRLMIMFQLIVGVTASQILIKRYALVTPADVFMDVKKCILPIVTIFFLLMLVPTIFLSGFMELAFGRIVDDLKFLWVLILGSEMMKLVGLFFHSYLVARTKVFPQMIFEGTMQAILFASVFLLIGGDFLKSYSMALCVSALVWLLLNFLFMVYLSRGEKVV